MDYYSILQYVLCSLCTKLFTYSHCFHYTSANISALGFCVLYFFLTNSSLIEHYYSYILKVFSHFELVITHLHVTHTDSLPTKVFISWVWRPPTALHSSCELLSVTSGFICAVSVLYVAITVGDSR